MGDMPKQELFSADIPEYFFICGWSKSNWQTRIEAYSNHDQCNSCLMSKNKFRS